MTPPLSPRALHLVNTSLRRPAPISQDEAAAALIAAGSPLFPAWLHFLTHYAGMKYCLDNSAIHTRSHYDVCFTPETGELPLDLDGAIILEETEPPFLDLGYYRAAGPFSMGLGADGMVLWDYKVPVFSSVEKLLESDAVMYELSQRTGEWWCLRGEASSVALQEFSRQTSLQVVEAAEDRWNRWWVGEEMYVHHFPVWGSSPRSSILRLYFCGASLETMQARFAACFHGTPSLIRWP